MKKLINIIRGGLQFIDVYLFDFICLFFFNDTATTEIYTLSLHDALPISASTACPSAVFRPCPGARVHVCWRARSRRRSRPASSKHGSSGRAFKPGSSPGWEGAPLHEIDPARAVGLQVVRGRGGAAVRSGRDGAAAGERGRGLPGVRQLGRDAADRL